MQKISAIDTAKLVLTELKKINGASDDENYEIVTKLKLLKLLYYVQGYHLAMFEAPLFNDKIEAWKYGPVVLSVYNWAKEKGDDAINREILSTEQIKNLGLHNQQMELINDVLRIYNRYSAYGLTDKTHKELPWLENYETGANNEIPQSDLKRFFAPLVEK